MLHTNNHNPLSSHADIAKTLIITRKGRLYANTSRIRLNPALKYGCITQFQFLLLILSTYTASVDEECVQGYICTVGRAC